MSVQAGGRPFGVCRNVRRNPGGGGSHRGSAGGRRSRDRRAKPATEAGDPSDMRACASRAGKPERACGGHGGLMAVSVRAGPRQKHVPRSVRIAAGAIRAGLKSRDCEAPPVGCGHHPARFGPRARCATFVHGSDMHMTPHFPKAKPACGPPDHQCPHPGEVFARERLCVFRVRPASKRGQPGFIPPASAPCAREIAS